MNVLSNWKSDEQVAVSGLLFDNTEIEVYFLILKNCLQKQNNNSICDQSSLDEKGIQAQYLTRYDFEHMYFNQ